MPAGHNKRKQEQGEGGDRKKRSWQSTRNNSAVPLGTRGFLISCQNGKERQAAHEAEALLTEFYEGLQPAKAEAAPAASSDFSSLIQSEVADMKDSKRKRLFEFHNTGISGLLYLIMDKEAGSTPAEVITAVCERVEATKQNRCRLCLRFLPIDVVCAANLEEIRRGAKRACSNEFPEEGPSLKFAVQYEHRASASIKRGELIDAVVEAVPKPPHVVNLNDPDKTIIVQLCKGQCALSVVSGYKRFAKFNLLELSQKEEKDAAAAAEAAQKQQQASAQEPGSHPPKPAADGAAEAAASEAGPAASKPSTAANGPAPLQPTGTAVDSTADDAGADATAAS